jgi:hypothetical protein
MKSKSILLLTGSHRGKKTTTNSILDYLEEKLSIYNTTVFREQVPAIFSNLQFVSRINEILQKCDAIVLCFPLYFDTLPYPLISALELLSNQSKKYNGIKIFSIVHCGLPEAAHCNNALAVCKNFSENMGFNYSGSAIIPDTGAIDGSSVKKTKRITSILNKLIAILNSSSVIDQKIILIGKPSMHPFFFRVFGNIIMKHFARKNKTSVFQKGYFC